MIRHVVLRLKESLCDISLLGNSPYFGPWEPKDFGCGLVLEGLEQRSKHLAMRK